MQHRLKTNYAISELNCIEWQWEGEAEGAKMQLHLRSTKLANKSLFSACLV